MSIMLMAEVWERAPFEGGALLVLLALADQSNEEHGRWCWPSISFLASKSRLSERQTTRIIGQLEAEGIIEVQRRTDDTSRYRLNSTKLNSLPSKLKRVSGDTMSPHTGDIFDRSGDTHVTQNINKTNHKRDTLPTREEELCNLAEKVYLEYPKHCAKPAALKAIKRAVGRLLCGEYSGMTKPSATDVLAYLLTRVSLYAKSREGEDPKYTPYPATWFNASRYLDKIDGDARVSSETSEDDDSASGATISLLDKVRKIREDS